MTRAMLQKRAGATLLATCAAAFLLLTMLVPNFAPWSPNAAAAADTAGSTSCVVAHFALDPNNPTKPDPAKESPGSVGPAVTQRDEAGIKAELAERRTCGVDGKFDPTLTASHYAKWSAAGLTKHQVAYANIDAFAAQMVADRTLYGSVVSELESLENASAFSIGTVAKGVWSIYMMPDGKGGVVTGQGQTQSAGTTAVFTHPGGVVVEYRLECGFQIVSPQPFPGSPNCSTTCTPTPPSTPPTPPPAPPKKCLPPTPHGTWPVCKDSWTADPYPQGHAPVGGGLNADPGPGKYVAPGNMQQPPSTPRVNPAPPAAIPPASSTSSSPAPVPTKDTAPAPTPEPQAPKPTAPETKCIPITGVETC